MKRLIKCFTNSLGSSYVVPEGVVRIDITAFEWVEDLKSITLPSTLTEIGRLAFHATKLREIIIPSGVTTLGWGALSNCGQVRKVVLSQGVTYLEQSAIAACGSMEELVIPDSVKTIGMTAIWYAQNLKTITYGGTVAQWEAIEKEPSWNMDCPTFTVVCTDGKIVIPSTIQ